MLLLPMRTLIRPRSMDAILSQSCFPQRAATESQIENESTALFATGRQWDDGIIDPRDTRDVLGMCLSAVHSNVVEGRRGFGVFRM